ncbi:MAG TPA: copper-binding protein [Hydrogenophaga sp.]|nr:copper-binding protein [Hydrogenophaga sp.]
MKHPMLALALMLNATTVPALGQTTDPASPHTAAPAAAPSDALPMTEAEVRRVDTTANKISLKHSEIKNLDMPPMTMVFQVSDPALLGKVKVGDKVRFTAAKVNGAYTVMSLEPAP